MITNTTNYGSCIGASNQGRVDGCSSQQLDDSLQVPTNDNKKSRNPIAVGVLFLLLCLGCGLFLTREGNIASQPTSFVDLMRVRVPTTQTASWKKNTETTHPPPDLDAYPRRIFITRTNVSLPVIGFPGVALARLSDPEDQSLANAAVDHAVKDFDLAYFDVAPEYGDGVAQERLGPALKPYRKHVFLAAKTMYRTYDGASNDLHNTLRALQTGVLDLYQFHSISTERDVDQILGAGGAMELFQQAKQEGLVRAIGFSAHSEPMAVRMIQTGLVDTCMFPINFAAWHYGGVGQKVLQAAREYGVGVIALKAGAKGRLTKANGNAVHVPDAFKHIPEWKRQEMLDYPVRTSQAHPTEWYEPEDDPTALHNLILWSLSQPGVTAVLPPGSLELLDGIYEFLHGKQEVPPFDEANIPEMLERYKGIVPIFHNRSEAGTKVST